MTSLNHKEIFLNVQEHYFLRHKIVNIRLLIEFSVVVKVTIKNVWI